MSKTYKVIGIDRENNARYRLTYTGDIEACKKYYVENGWKEKDLIFEDVEKTKREDIKKFKKLIAKEYEELRS